METIKDKIIVWKPIEDLEDGMMDVEAIHDDYEGFRVLLRTRNGSGHMLRVTFPYRLAYRVIDESYFLTGPVPVDKTSIGNVFYQIENSSYVDSFHESSAKAYTDWKIVHYTIYTSEDCIDILSGHPPKVEWLNKW